MEENAIPTPIVFAPHTEDQPLPNLLACKVCKYVIQESWYFCPNCGKKLKHKPRSNSVWSQIKVYAISILFPPLGIFPGLGYLLERNNKSKLIGLICIILTLLSLYVSIIYITNLLKQVDTELTHAVMPLQTLGY